MAGDTTIEWCDKVWNPIVGCSIVSPGCTNCYAMKMAGRWRVKSDSIYYGLTIPTNRGTVWSGKLALQESALKAPLRWRKPQRIFVNSMGDLFHESVPDPSPTSNGRRATALPLASGSNPKRLR